MGDFARRWGEAAKSGARFKYKQHRGVMGRSKFRDPSCEKLPEGNSVLMGLIQRVS